MKDYIENESLPHKKSGKNQGKSSPNRHGCNKNDFNAHSYKQYNFIFKLEYDGGKTLPRTSSVNRCEFCGKRKTGRWKFDAEKKNFPYIFQNARDKKMYLVVEFARSGAILKSTPLQEWE